MPTLDRFRPTVIELAGLPGAGKTTLANAIAEIDDRFVAHIVRGPDDLASAALHLGGTGAASSAKRSLARRLAPWLATPITLFRFRSFLMHLAWLLMSSRVRALFGSPSSPDKLSGDNPSLRLILSRLNFVVARNIQMRIRAWRSRKSVLVEQGYVQEAISIRLRLPQRWRSQLWNRYLSGIPRNCLCVVLEISAQDALGRIQSREQDQPSLRFSKRAQKSWQNEGGSEWLHRALEDVVRSMSDPAVRSQFKFIYVSVLNDEEHVMNEVHRAVLQLSERG